MVIYWYIFKLQQCVFAEQWVTFQDLCGISQIIPKLW